MIAPRGNDEQGFAYRVPTIRFAFEQQAADGLSTRRPARLARALDGDTGVIESGDQQIDLGRLPGPLPAFDRDKPATALRRTRIGRDQRRLPQIR